MINTTVFNTTDEQHTETQTDNHPDSIEHRTNRDKLNEMLQGGFRSGECAIIPALHHKPKTICNDLDVNGQVLCNRENSE